MNEAKKYCEAYYNLFYADDPKITYVQFLELSFFNRLSPEEKHRLEQDAISNK